MITATLYNYYHLCHRKVWLCAYGITMEHSSDLVSMGRHLHETVYPRRRDRYREFQLPGAKIDHYDPEEGIVYEIKKSNKNEHAHLAQLKYYLWLLRQHGLKSERGILEYPSQRRTLEVMLEPGDGERIAQSVLAIQGILQSSCPPRKESHSRCRNCSYEAFCWVEEEKSKSGI
ncbi:MAG: CRISPR-associated protein Cas4 [Bacteroidota bacterium]